MASFAEEDFEDDSDDEDDENDYETDEDSDDDEMPDLDDESAPAPPETPETLKEQGNACYKAKNYVSAVAAYTRAINLAAQLGKPEATYFLNRASAHMMRLSYKEAAADCDRALEFDSSNAKALFRKGKALLAGGHPQEAAAAITLGLVREPGNASALKDRGDAETVGKRLQLARQCLLEKKYVQVWKQIQEIEKFMSGGQDMTMMKIEALCCIGRHSEAYALTTAMMRTNARAPGLLFWRSKCLYYMDQVAPAIKHLQEAMRNDPDNSSYRTEIKKWRSMEAQKEAGNLAFKQGRMDEAIDKWTECLGMDPSHRSYNAKLYLNRGTAHSKMRRHENCVEDCTKALELDDKYLKALNKRAEALRVLGEKEHLERALRDLQAAMELDGEEKQREYKQKIRATQAELKRAGREDLYKLLGAPKDASEDELKKLYKKAALKWHPDRWAAKTDAEKETANATFQKINRAFEILGDKQKRARYDAGADADDLDDPSGGGGGGGHSHGGFGGMSPEMMHMFMRQHMGGRGGF